MTATTGRARLKPLEGTWCRYDGANEDELADLAGDRWAGLDDGGLPRITGRDGRPVPVHPGDTAVRWDGLDWIIVHTAPAFRAQAEPLP